MQLLHLVHPKDLTPREKRCGVVCEIQCEGCKVLYLGETARPFGVRFKSIHNGGWGSPKIGPHFVLLFDRRFREAIDIFCRVPKSRSNETFCHVIHSINHLTKRPNPSLDKYSAMESKACV